MSSRAKTIQIFLPSGDPRELRIAEITTRIVRVIDVPRILLNEFLKLPEAQQVGLYFLIGDADDAELTKLYIGQSGAGVGARLSQHHQNKGWWNRALVVVSLTNSITQTHALFLEWNCIKEAGQAGRYSLENGNAGTKPHTPLPLEADCLEIFETSRTLVATLGYPIFEPLSKHPSKLSEREMFYCKVADVEGRGEYTTEGFVVLKGSTARLENVPSIVGELGERYRNQLVESGVMAEKDGVYEFTRDHLFSSPSMAGLAILGRTSNGWMDWKTKDGKTLDEVKRKPSNEQSA